MIGGPLLPDSITGAYLGTVFGRSEPGEAMHRLLVATAPPGSSTMFGLPDLSAAFIMIAPVGGSAVEADQFVNQSVMAAIVDARRKGTVIHFAGLAMEMHGVAYDGNEVTENRARVLLADGRLEEHAAAVEVTKLYAAARDGRRWTGVHTLTGARAGHITGPTVRTGSIDLDEEGMPWQLIRAAVGIGPLPGLIRR